MSSFALVLYNTRVICETHGECRASASAVLSEKQPKDESANRMQQKPSLPGVCSVLDKGRQHA